MPKPMQTQEQEREVKHADAHSTYEFPEGREETERSTYKAP